MINTETLHTTERKASFDVNNPKNSNEPINRGHLFALLSNDVAKSYITPGSSHEYRQHTLMERQGFFPVVASSGEIVNVNWETKDQDYAVWKRIFDAIDNTGEIDDETFRMTIIPQLKELSLQSPVFERLHDKNIRTSKAHTQTPADHIWSVMESLDTSAISREGRIRVRKEAFGHDLAKLMIAYMDFYQNHAKLSALMLRDLAVELNLDNNFLRVIEFHHIYELIERNVIGVEEFQQLIPDLQTFEEVTVLSFADAWSAEKHRNFAVKNVAQSFMVAMEMLSKLKTGSPDLFERLNTFIKNFTKRVVEIVEGFLEEASSLGGEIVKTLQQILDALKIQFNQRFLLPHGSQ